MGARGFAALANKAPNLTLAEIYRYFHAEEQRQANTPEIDTISDLLVGAGAEPVMDRIKPGQALPADAEIAELITMLVRFRTQAVATVTARLASSIASNIESLVSRVLAEYLESTSSA